MFLFYFSITLAICSSALYHFTQKQIPSGANPAVSVIVTYVVSIALCLVLLYFLPPENGFISALKQLNWASYVLALSLVGLEVGFLLVYRAGWNIGLAAVLVNVVASLILVPVAIFVFKDKLNWVNIVGILVCLAGLVMLNWKR
jgi:drug/metabolite transporter (DMT)-like permease